MEIQSKSLKDLCKTEDIFQLKVGDMCVEMVYSENSRRFNECVLNILKVKMK